MNGGGGSGTGGRIVGIFETALKVVVGLTIVLLVLAFWPTDGGGSALSEALGGIGGAIGQLDDLIRDIRTAAGNA